MIEKIKKAITTYGFTDVKLKAFVSESMSSVVFYVVAGSGIDQSIQMAENGLVDPLKIKAFEDEIVSIVRGSKEYDQDKMNVIEFIAPSTVEVSHMDRNCSVDKIKKAWDEKVRKM